MQLSIANAPTSWGVERADGAKNPRWERMLDEVAGAGYAGVELGPLGYLPEEGFVLRRELELRRLQLAAGYLFEPLHDPSARAAVLELTQRTCRLLGAAGAPYLVVIQGFTPERESTAGRRAAAVPLGDTAWQQMIEVLHDVARVAREEHGLTACFHPHAGTGVEFEDEVERLVAETEPGLVNLCLDTGHAVFAGIDPVVLYERHADRVAYLHLKDVDSEVLDRVRSQELGFEQAVAEGVFCPIGTGAVDFVGLSAALCEHRYRGWATVEQDLLADAVRSPASDARTSLAALRTAGFG